MIEKLTDLVLKDWWWGSVLSPILNQTAVVTVFCILSVVTLFAMLRYQYQNWGRRMWVMEGLELVGAAGCGAIFTLGLYFLPVVVVFWVGVGLVFVICEVFSYLVILSCGGKKE